MVTPLVNIAVVTPVIVAVTPEIQSRAPETEIGRSKSFEGNSQLLDAFLKSSTGVSSTHLDPAKSVPSDAFNSTILTLPLNTIKKILRNLLISPSPLILQHDCITTPQEYRSYVEPNILQVCKVFYNIGTPILYGENTLTTSSPATSFDFDKHLLSLSGSKRQMITNIKLEIDWADQLWSKFPLVARVLGELKGLLKLEIGIVEKEKTAKNKQIALMEEDKNLQITMAHDQNSSGKDKTVHQRAIATDRTAFRVKRQGPMADVMLKAEMKMLRDLVDELKALKEFRLIGFRHEVFGWCLEEYVQIRNR